MKGKKTSIMTTAEHYTLLCGIVLQENITLAV